MNESIMTGTFYAGNTLAERRPVNSLPSDQVHLANQACCHPSTQAIRRHEPSVHTSRRSLSTVRPHKPELPNPADSHLVLTAE